MSRNPRLVRAEIKIAKRTWRSVGATQLKELRAMVQRNGVSVALGDVRYIENHWYVTHAGLLRLAHRKRCAGIKTNIQRDASDPLVNRWVFRAIVYTSPHSVGFVGYGDADPSNTSSVVRGAEMRVAETRAVNRVLRKAYGIGLCSVEELGSQPASIPPLHEGKTVHPPDGNRSASGQPKLRDKLCLLIRKYELDPNLAKRYAADFCGTESLRDAGRDLVEAFVSTVAEEAAKDRAALVCKLNSYSQPEEVKS
jgi:hypothetical protein